MRRKSDSDGEDASGADPALELAVLLGTDEEESEMRPIDADALLENYGLKDAVKYGNKDALQQSKSYSTLMLYEIANLIEDAPTIEPSANWTPCAEGTPEPRKLCLVTYSCGEQLYITLSAYINEKYGWTGMHEGGHKTVIAWQPLPEPYNPNKKAQEA